MTEVTQPSEKVGGKRRMTDEEDGDDVEDGRWMRQRTGGGRGRGRNRNRTRRSGVHG